MQCVVISVNYRHAPEHVYPAAADDSFYGYEWIVSPERDAELHLDTSRIAIGGLSAYVFSLNILIHYLTIVADPFPTVAAAWLRLSA